MNVKSRELSGSAGVSGDVASRPGPGKRTLTMGLPARHHAGPPEPQPLVQAKAESSHGPVGTMQANAASGPRDADDPFGVHLLDQHDVHTIAARGTSGSPEALPHAETIQRSFGQHDVSRVHAHLDERAQTAAAGIGAAAFAAGDHIAFGSAPDLHTAAHEAAHVVQQRSGVHLKGGVGTAEDAYEQHADAVADLVVRGGSAETLLSAVPGGSATAAVQRKPFVPPPGGVSADVVRVGEAAERLAALAVQAEAIASGLRASETTPSLACVAISGVLGHAWADVGRLAGVKKKLAGLDEAVADARFMDLADAVTQRDASADAVSALRDAMQTVRRDLHRLDGAARVVAMVASLSKPPPRELIFLASQVNVVVQSAKPLDWAPLAPVDLRAETADRGGHADAASIDESTLSEPTGARHEGEYGAHGVETLGSEHYRIWGFALGSADAPPSSAKTLDMVADMALADEQATIAISGHTSASGSERFNDNLSEERAYRILEELVGRGVAASRIVALGAGESRAIIDEKSDPARMARNRRVEIAYRGVAGVQDDGRPTEPAKPMLGCADLRMQAKWDLVAYDAWVNWWTDGGYGQGRGVKDRNLDGDSIRPTLFQVRMAANQHGFRSDHDIQALAEQIVPISIGANLDTHMRQLKESAKRIMAMSKDPHHCDPSKGPSIKLMTFDDTLDTPNRTTNPVPNSRSPGGPRY